jgi:phenylalanyl-tRNA synthetase beta chain
MKFSENWLRSQVNPALSSEELSHVLTMAGLEVEELEAVAPAFSNVVIAEILSAEKHPDADRLQVCTVNVGQAEPLQIVCGAPNARAGLKAPCALVGASLPGFEIKRAKVRGVESFGMMCSAKELGLAEESNGILELPTDATVGTSIREYFDLDDKLLTLKLTPNRSDCLSITGIAREVSALTATPHQAPVIATAPITHKEQKTVRVNDAADCPRYTGRIVHNVNAAAATPDWMKQRLERSGLRSISAIVDITNYVLLELGQPMHAFDLAKLKGDIVVRMANAGEQIELLNQQTIKIEPDFLVISDDSGALALAGIMGGVTSSVTPETTDIFLESAFFNPAVIVGKARRLGFSSDSSYRFERGVDFAATELAMERATQLVMEICGGSAGPITEVLSELPLRFPVALRLQRLQRVLGIAFEAADIANLLQRLGMPFKQDQDTFTVTPPSWRFDISLEEDLIEEIARLHGYDNILPQAPEASMQMLPAVESRRSENAIRQFMASRDYQEAITYSFVEESWERDLAGNGSPIKLRNPIASNMSVMRSTPLGGLLDALTYNLNRKQSRVRLFEIGACFAADGASYTQQNKLAGLCYGDAEPEQWGSASRSIDFFDVKADIEALTGNTVTFSASQHPALHPGQCAQIMLQGRPIGVLGSLHPRLQQQYDLPRSTVLFEMDLEALLAVRMPQFTEVPKFPPIRRDLALVVDESVTVQAMLDAMKSVADNVVSEVALFDVYRGKGIDQGKKSLAFLVLMQDTQKTLTDEDADTAITKMVAVLMQQFGAVLRS